MSSEIRKLLVACVRFLKGSDSKSASGFPSEMIDFLVETVEATVEDDTIMTEDEAMTMLLGNAMKKTVLYLILLLLCIWNMLIHSSLCV
jgi:hypothetical protein